MVYKSAQPGQGPGEGLAPTKLGHRILNVLDTGPRKLNVLRGLAKTEPEFERAIGWLFIKGLVVFTGKTSGRLLARNGRRMKS
jgi:hypothetical protein